MDILQEIVDKTIWSLFDHMDQFEYDNDYEILDETVPSQSPLLDDIWFGQGSANLVDVLNTPSQRTPSEQQTSFTKKKAIYEAMKKDNDLIIQESFWIYLTILG